MLEKIEILRAGLDRKIKAFPKGKVIEFDKGINLLVGENGAGKSSLIKALTQYDPKKKNRTINVTGEGKFLSFDTEKDNPRTKDPNLNPTMFAFSVAARFQSHGEIIFPIMKHAAKAKRGELIIVDEPEAALSFSHQLKLMKLWQGAIKKGVQFLIATHSPVFMTMKNVNVIKLDDTYDKVMEWLNELQGVPKRRIRITPKSS